MRILWMSDNPTSPTGLGNVTRFVCAGLAELGHEVAIVGWEKRGAPLRQRSYTVYPAGNRGAEASVLLRYLRKLRPEVLITLADPWRVSHIAQPKIRQFMHDARIVWAHYCPIDTDMGSGALPASTIHLQEIVDLPIAMSNYGRRLFLTNGVEPAFIPHGVDTKLFSPPQNKGAAKRDLGYASKFVILSDARNQIRKMLPRTLEIFRRFAAGKKDVLLHLHCDPFDPASHHEDYCYDILADIKFLGLTEKVRFTRGFSIGRGTALGKLAALYQGADVHLLASFGEGFGLPSLQAASTGVVPMASAYSASHELVKGHGAAIRVERFVKDGWGLRRALIDIDDAVEKLNELYKNRSLLRSKSEAACRFAQSYSWDRIVPQWHDLLQAEVPRLRERATRKLRAVHSEYKAPKRMRGPSTTSSSLSRNGHLPDHIQTRINELESRGEMLTAEMIRSGRLLERPFTIPVTPPLPRPSSANLRVVGRVFLASAADVTVFLRLKQIFPNLSAWSTQQLRFGLKNKPYSAGFKVVSPGGEDVFRYLSSSIIAIARRGVARELAVQTAYAGVPLIASTDASDGEWPWPELIVEAKNSRAAAVKCHWMLTDLSATMSVCKLARQRIAGKRRGRSKANC